MHTHEILQHLDKALEGLHFFVVMNHEGKFFRRKGYGGYGDSWVDKLDTARVYTKLAHARTIVTYFANDARYPVPVIVQLHAKVTNVMHEEVRIEEAKQKRLLGEAGRRTHAAKCSLQRAQQILADAQATYDKLKEKAC